MRPDNDATTWFLTCHLEEEIAKRAKRGEETDSLKRALETFVKTKPVKQKSTFITLAFNSENLNKERIESIKEKLLSLKDKFEYFSKYIFNLEFYSTNSTDEINFHSHILISNQMRYDKQRIIRDMSRTFEIAKNFVNVKRGRTQQDYENMENYVKGIKKSESKTESLQKDRLFRRKHDILDFYSV